MSTVERTRDDALELVSRRDRRRAIAAQHDLPELVPEKRISPELVVTRDPFHPCAEQVRALRTQLLVRWANCAIHGRMLAITSPGRAEGRSYLAANLAVAFSQLGEHTLLIDADLRNPRQHRIFNVDDAVGLSTMLSGRAHRDAIVPLREFDRLSLLPAGAPAPNPLELLSRDAFVVLLHELKREFQVVLIDTPAAQICADAQTIAFRAGSALVLARRDHTRYADVHALIERISDAGARVAGTVFNVF
jgi:chain length determinant protein tyrosine kinase EpsG